MNFVRSIMEPCEQSEAISFVDVGFLNGWDCAPCAAAMTDKNMKNIQDFIGSFDFDNRLPFAISRSIATVKILGQNAG